MTLEHLLEWLTKSVERTRSRDVVARLRHLERGSKNDKTVEEFAYEKKTDS